VGRNETILDTVFDPPGLPAYLSQQALEVYAAAHARHGFTPLLRYYRNLDPNRTITAFLAGRKLTQPAAFIGAAADPSNELPCQSMTRLNKTCRTCASRSCWMGWAMRRRRKR